LKIFKNRQAFTLVELLLAIFLVGLFAYFVFATPTKCKECYYVTNLAKPQNAPMPLVLNVKAEYILDRNSNPEKLELGRFDDKKVCMRLRHYKNGSISQVILDLGDKFLFIPSYFGKGKEFNSLNEAVSWWVKDSQNSLRSRGEWY